MISGKEALNEILIIFPQLSEEIEEDDGLLHLQIGTFSHLAQSFIDSENSSEFSKVCSLFVKLFPGADSDLENALNVSFLEHLGFIDGKCNRSWAYDAMPREMRKAWDEMEEYNAKIHGSR
ncbi:MAG: hypothetical protein P1U67_12680 [Alcanivoracaceae bacterium]|nr:hypothetical protein [Alcanivoracaceae bacterium]